MNLHGDFRRQRSGVSVKSPMRGGVVHSARCAAIPDTDPIRIRGKAPVRVLCTCKKTIVQNRVQHAAVSDLLWSASLVSRRASDGHRNNGSMRVGPECSERRASPNRQSGGYRTAHPASRFVSQAGRPHGALAFPQAWRDRSGSGPAGEPSPYLHVGGVAHRVGYYLHGRAVYS